MSEYRNGALFVAFEMQWTIRLPSIINGHAYYLWKKGLPKAKGYVRLKYHY